MYIHSAPVISITASSDHLPVFADDTGLHNV